MGITIGGFPVFNFSLHDRTARDYDTARHPHELPRRDFLELHTDLAQCGLGTGSCGPDTLPRYRIAAGEHRLEFEIVVGPPRAG